MASCPLIALLCCFILSLSHIDAMQHENIKNIAEDIDLYESVFRSQTRRIKDTNRQHESRRLLQIQSSFVSLHSFLLFLISQRSVS